MQILQLKKLLDMYPDDMEVFIQTVPQDLCSPLETKHFSMIKANIDEKSKNLNPAKLLLTSYHPEGK